MKTKITITVRKGDKDSVIDIPPKTLCKAADLRFTIDDCEWCNRNFKLNKMEKDVYKILEILWTADEWAHVPQTWYRLEKGKKGLVSIPNGRTTSCSRGRNGRK